MVKALSTVAGVAAIALAASAGTADAECFGAHKDVTASISQPKQGAAMSTFDGKLPTTEEQSADQAKAAEAPAETAGDDQDRK